MRLTSVTMHLDWVASHDEDSDTDAHRPQGMVEKVLDLN